MDKVEFPKNYQGLDFYPGQEVPNTLGGAKVKVDVAPSRHDPEGPLYIFMTVATHSDIQHFALHETKVGPITVPKGKEKTALKQVGSTLSSRTPKEPKTPTEASLLRSKIHRSLEQLTELY